MAEYKGVAVYCEVTAGKLVPIATEGLGIGRKLADEIGQELSAVLVGSDVSGLAQETIAYGADKAYVVDDPLLKDYQTDSYVSVMEKVVNQLLSMKIRALGISSLLKVPMLWVLVKNTPARSTSLSKLLNTLG